MAGHAQVLAAGDYAARWWDEIEVGDGYETESRTIEAADVLAFADLTGDHHPVHVDAEWAARSVFGGQVAHGLLVLSMAAGLMPVDPDRVVLLRALEDVTFKRPVAIGDSISVRATVDNLRPVDDEVGVVGTRVDAVNERGRVVLRARMTVLWRRQPGS